MTQTVRRILAIAAALGTFVPGAALAQLDLGGTLGGVVGGVTETVGNTVGAVGNTVESTVGTVGNTVESTVGTVESTVGAVGGTVDQVTGSSSSSSSATQSTAAAAAPTGIVTLDQSAVLNAVNTSKALPLADIMARARQQVQGDIVDAQLIAVRGFLLYALKVVDTDGDVSDIYFYARSGEPVRAD